MAGETRSPSPGPRTKPSVMNWIIPPPRPPASSPAATQQPRQTGGRRRRTGSCSRAGTRAPGVGALPAQDGIDAPAAAANPRACTFPQALRGPTDLPAADARALWCHDDRCGHIPGYPAEGEMDDRQRMRASDQDRQAVVDRLRSALEEGRLKTDEFEERM